MSFQWNNISHYISIYISNTISHYVCFCPLVMWSIYISISISVYIWNDISNYFSNYFPIIFQLYFNLYNTVYFTISLSFRHSSSIAADRVRQSDAEAIGITWRTADCRLCNERNTGFFQAFFRDRKFGPWVLY